MTIGIILVDVLLDIDPDVYGLYLTTDKKWIKQLISQCTNITYKNMVENIH